MVKLVRMVLDYSTFSLTDEPVRTATMSAIEAAEKAGVWISFDPNLRKPLWESEEQDYEKAIRKLRTEFQIPLILLSLGKDGSRAYCGEKTTETPAFLNDIKT